MARSLTAQSLIQLPMLSAEETLTLATKLLTAARAVVVVPAGASATLGDLEASLAVLSTELLKRGQLMENNAAARDADVQIDRAWSAIDRLLAAWASIDEPALSEAAAALRQRLFPDGLGFLTKTFNAEWAGSEQRLAMIDAEGHAGTFERLGGAPFVANLRRAHEAYGKALGVTEVKGAPPAPPQIREAREAVLEDIRVYAAQVVASVSRRDPATEETAERLLRPIAEWPTRRSAAGKAGAMVGVVDAAPTPVQMAQAD